MKGFFSGIFAVFSTVSMMTIPVYALEGPPSFSDVDRIFQARCVKCHSGTRPPQGLRLDNYKDVIAGGKEGPVIVEGDPAKSALVKRIKGILKPRMPNDGPPWLSESDVKLIVNWIAAGAPQ